MRVYIFKGPGDDYGFTGDLAGGNLPAEKGPWQLFREIDMVRGESESRIGADEVEQLVVQELCRQQGRDDQITDAASGTWSADIRELVRTTIARIVIHHDGIEIVLKRNAIDRAGGFVDGDTQDESPKTV